MAFPEGFSGWAERSVGAADEGDAIDMKAV